MTTIQSPGVFCQLWKKCDQKTSNASKDYNLQFRDAKLCELIALILERDKLKNKAETGKCSIFQEFEGKFPQFVPEW